MDVENAFLTLSRPLQSRLAALAITKPTPVQQKVMPLIAKGKSLLFESETGTGKTFAYLLPIIAALEANENPKKCVRFVIVSPTLELASQIRDMAKSMSDLRCALLLGRAPIKRQIDLLKEKPEIVIGNVSRLLELTQIRKLKLDGVSYAVFDEVDRLVKKEAIDDLTEFAKLLPRNAQIVGCSATITKQTRDFFKNCEYVAMPKEDVLRKKITHWAIFAERRDKIETLRKLLAALKPEKALVFAARGAQVENIAAKLKYKNVDCAALYAKEDKQKRKVAIDRFRSGKCRILITSDLAARGLDIVGISHIVQMDLDEDADFFIHRAGRTGRMGKTGVNIVIGNEGEMRRYAAIEKKLGITVHPKALYNGKVVAADKADGEL